MSKLLRAAPRNRTPSEFSFLAEKAHQSKNATHGDVFTLVSHVDITWNSFLPYLINLADKLEGLGFRYVDNEVMAPKEVTDEK